MSLAFCAVPLTDLKLPGSHRLSSATNGGATQLVVQTVPEPSTLALLHVGLAGILVRRRANKAPATRCIGTPFATTFP